MNLFKKLFGKKKNKEKKNESWYNDSHEKKKGRWSEPVPGIPLSDNSVDNNTAMSMTKD